MKFEYKRYGPDVLRPVIPIEVVHDVVSVPYEVLVDSGADFCIFDAELAVILGIDIFKGEEQSVFGITGVSQKYYVHDITIKVGGWPYKIKAGFLPDMPPMGYGVVGQKGFFEFFTVRFDLLKEEIELKPNRKA